MKNEYFLLDSGLGRKLEKFGAYVIDRPALGALWQPQHPKSQWQKAQAIFTREGENNWQGLDRLPESWTIQVSGITFKISGTDFGHLGIFPEQAANWQWIQKTIKDATRPIKVLNLFAYSGGSTLAAAKAGAEVCHLDASKSMVTWARENASLNQLDKAPIRWIVDDVSKFLRRELNRQHFYDAIILDPPSFGRGAKGEVFKIEEALPSILEACKNLMSQKPLFVLLTCHTAGITPTSLGYILSDYFKGKIETGEMFLESHSNIRNVPSGVFARWKP